MVKNDGQDKMTNDLPVGTLMLLVCNFFLVLVPVSPGLPLVTEQQIYP